MKIFRITSKIYLPFLLLFFANAIAQGNSINHYQKYFGTGSYNGKSVAVIRSYSVEKQLYYVAVDFENLKTNIIASDKINLMPKTWNDILKQFTNTNYIKAIDFAKEHAIPMQDAGIEHGAPDETGIALTIDLCPSHKPLDRVIFTSIAQEFKKQDVPIALSITGKFLKSHPEDIQWLQEQVKSGLIEIVWVNHTYNHRYEPKLPIQENFLLEAGTDINAEILLLEQALLEKGILFSAFFRFPGLISDSALVGKVTDYGLIPIGSDAWLAKGQMAQNGDIVLIHGNGNEPLGIKDFLTLLKKENNAIRKKKWILYDLREDIEEEFSKK